MKRYSDRSIRRYRDSQRKLAIAKRRYVDALRRYRDAEEEAQISKFKALKAKVNEKFAMFAKDHPDMVKYLRKFSVITTEILAILATAATAGLSAINAHTAVKLKKHGFSLKEIAGMVPSGIGALISGMASIALWIANRALKQNNG